MSGRARSGWSKRLLPLLIGRRRQKLQLAAGLPAPLHLEARLETYLLLPLLVTMGRAEESRRPGKGRFHVSRYKMQVC